MRAIYGRGNSSKQEAIKASIRQYVDEISRPQKWILLLILDLLLFLLAAILSIGLRFDFESWFPLIVTYQKEILLLVVIQSIVFLSLGIYKAIVRHISAEFVFSILSATALSGAIVFTLRWGLNQHHLPWTALANYLVLVIVGVTAIRLLARRILWWAGVGAVVANDAQRVAIYGAGNAGATLARSLQKEAMFDPICFIDDDPALQRRRLLGLSVHSPRQIRRLQQKQGIEAIFVAIPSLTGKRRQEILEDLQQYKLAVKTVPSIGEILSGSATIDRLRDIDIEDLLGREPVAPDDNLLGRDITDKIVLVTGAGGSIGTELCRQIAKAQPRELILYELSEFALYRIDLELTENHPTLTKTAHLGSVVDRERLLNILQDHRVQTVYHAAAYKHVPLVEANPISGIINNIIGTRTAMETSIAAGVEKFVLISTDKAVRPTNIMGTTKRVAELILQARAATDIDTCLTMVRFGNVLGSSGSVIPRFQEQLATGKPLTVTHADITRYFMSIPEAASLVIQAGAMATGGEVFLLQMGEPVKIYDLAAQMIRLHGLEPEVDVPILITGLRPGEKIYEELLLDMEKATPTEHHKIFCGRETWLPQETVEKYLAQLESAIGNHAEERCIELLRRMVPEYKPTPSRLVSVGKAEVN
jgi:FlaA1/EpsC-like NDP-sugar epimerase